MQDVLSRGASFRFKAAGWSMTPFIKDGDVVTVAPLEYEKPSVGKVVAFIQPDSGRLLVHRIIAARPAAYLIQGDNTLGQPDGLVPASALLGCVTRVERSGRRVYLGLGMERRLLAGLSRNHLLLSAVHRVSVLHGWLKNAGLG